MEQTLVLIKPDGVQRGLTGEIIKRLENRGLKLVAAKFLLVDESLAKKHYAVHEGKPFYAGLIKYYQFTAAGNGLGRSAGSCRRPANDGSHPPHRSRPRLHPPRLRPRSRPQSHACLRLGRKCQNRDWHLVQAI